MTIKIAAMRNIHVDNLSGDTAAAGFEAHGARFHLWFNWRTLEITSPLYKNPLRADLKTTDPEYFHTRALDPGKGTNCDAVAHLFAEIKRLGLVTKAQQQIRLAIRKARQERAENHRRAKIRDHGEELLAELRLAHDLLQQLLPFAGDGERPVLIRARVDRIRRAMIKAAGVHAFARVQA
jgi:hypothetical protein